MSGLSLGIIETVGLTATIVAADTCMKSANVSLVGYELSKGGGMAVVKIEGDIGAVKAAIFAAEKAVEKVTSVWGSRIIARPSDEIEKLIRNEDTVGFMVLKDIKDEEKVEEKIEISCNVCNDPKCIRKKGELRSLCINYRKK